MQSKWVFDNFLLNIWIWELFFFFDKLEFDNFFSRYICHSNDSHPGKSNFLSTIFCQLQHDIKRIIFNK